MIWRHSFFVSIFIFCATFLSATPARAMSLSPSILDAAIAPGETVSTSFALTNTDKEEKQYSVDLMRVTLGSQEGEMTFAPLDAASADWFDVKDASVTLAPGATKEIAIHIHPPASALSQVFVLGIRVTEQSKSEVGVVLRSGAVELAFLTIGEGLSPQIQILSFDFPPRFLMAFPSRSAITIRNDGNGVGIPDGSFVARDLFGSIIGNFPLNPEGRRVPPGQTRTWFIETPISGWINSYTLDLVGGEENGFAPIGETHRVFLLSPWVIGGILIGAMLFVVALRQRKRQ